MKWSVLVSACLLLLCFVACFIAQAASETPAQLLVTKPRSEFDINHQYYTSLLKKALTKAAAGRTIPELKPTFAMEQGRALRELAKGESLDVFWVGTDLDKEQEFRAIRIPLERGLMGFRKFILRKDSIAKFNSIRSLQQLQQLTACQGAFWPDVEIMRSSGLKVEEAPVYENIFKQLLAGRCDYFPRGLHEGVIELEKRQALYPELVRYNKLMLHYPFAVYFFTRKENEALALWIEQGLEQMIDDGELLAHMQQQELTRHVFPLQHHSSDPWISIKNPLLSPDTPVTNSRYWFQPQDFKVDGE
ncbi:hypothetical protein [Rheinheimera sp. MM224]|uniref:hypothetical protein n=1 Tax=Rheinheimera sp. MM224 TaxID=3019969 RepID=UPI0021F8206D|nr:hypothetical protein [Rheinheimera sp. MM224]CAI3794707.1 hypothetical protein JAMGFMIE_01130 [Rheinheimera sp. MM224]